MGLGQGKAGESSLGFWNTLKASSLNIPVWGLIFFFFCLEYSGPQHPRSVSTRSQNSMLSTWEGC